MKKIPHNLILTGEEIKTTSKYKGILNLLIIIAILGTFLFGNGITGMVVGEGPEEMSEIKEINDSYFLQLSIGGIVILAVIILLHHHIFHHKPY